MQCAGNCGHFMCTDAKCSTTSRANTVVCICCKHAAKPFADPGAMCFDPVEGLEGDTRRDTRPAMMSIPRCRYQN